MSVPRDPAVIRLSACVYRALLRCYPASFRESYERELGLVFRDCCRAAYRRCGVPGVLGLWPAALADLVLTVGMEWITYRGGLRMVAKRIFDLVAVMLLLLVTAPLQLVLAVLIKLDSPGPVFYRDQRLGRGGRAFTMLKFRTMTSYTPHRVTRVGRWLRPTSLDELPQLLNVLCGEMSLVGPRPLYPGALSVADAEVGRVLAVTPGVAGRGQLARAAGAPAEDEWAQSLAYAERRTLRNDLRILRQTLMQLLRAR